MSDNKIEIDSGDIVRAQQHLRELGRVLDRIPGQADKAEGSIKKMATASKEAESMGKALGVAISAATVAIGYFAVKTINSMDALNDLSDATGASVENLSALQDVAQRTGVKFSTVESALIKFNSQLDKAEPDNKVGKALKAIGLNAEELKRVDPAEALRLTAVALDGFADNGNKARLTQELFGKSVKEVGPYLKDLAAQNELVATTTKAEALEAERFNKNVFELQNNVSKFSQNILKELLPALNQATRGFNDLYRASGGFNNTIQNADLVGDYGNTLKTKLADEIKQLEARKKAFENNWSTAGMKEDQAAYVKGAELRISIIRKLLDNERQYAEDSRRNFTSVDPRVLGDPRNSAPEVSDDKKPKAHAPTLDKEIMQHQQKLAALQGISGEQLILNKFQDDYYNKFPKKQVEELRTLELKELALKEGKELQEVLYAEMLKQADLSDKQSKQHHSEMSALSKETDLYKIQVEVMKKYGATQRDVAIAQNEYNLQKAEELLLYRSLDGFKAGEEQQLRNQVELLRKKTVELKKTNEIDESEKTRQQSFSYGWESAFDKYQDDAGNAAKNAQTLFSTASQGMEDAFTKFALTGKLSFSDMARSILADLAKIAAKQMVSSVFKMFLGSADGNVFDTSGVLKSAKGNVFDGPTLHGYSGGVGMLGEAGAEAVMPLKRNASGQLGVITQGGGGSQQNTISISVTVQGGNTNDQTGNAVAAKVAEQFTRGIVRQELMNARRTGGMLNPV